jgi:anion-transporting  ArsA/GET3 family ATPase
MTVATLLKGKRLVICGGPGGVGKTTSSAAVALGMAAAGATVAVITIDPAKRLANALGLRQLGNEPVRVSPECLTSDGATVGGELWAMTLDVKRTLDDLVDRAAPDAARAAEIKSNRIYEELSTAIAGSQEFTAVVKLHELDRTGRFDVLVLDTPPSRHALDFLHAPGRLSAFLDTPALQAFKGPTGIGLRAFSRGASPLVDVMGRLSGVDLLADASTFFRLLGTVTDDFGKRAAQVEAMLRASSTGFLLITSAEPQPVDETIRFRRALLQGGFPFTGIVVNRVHGRLGPQPLHSELAAYLTSRLSADLAGRVTASAEAYESLVHRDELTISRLRDSFPADPILTVPHLRGGVHDVDGLWDLHEHLFAP